LKYINVFNVYGETFNKCAPQGRASVLARGDKPRRGAGAPGKISSKKHDPEGSGYQGNIRYLKKCRFLDPFVLSVTKCGYHILLIPVSKALPLIRQPAADTFPESRKAFLSSSSYIALYKIIIYLFRRHLI
jgi:hypothetical protein